jgi:uncharacterized RDD family membrane protein YckC
VVPAYNIYKKLFGESETYIALNAKAQSGAALTTSESLELLMASAPSIGFQSIAIAVVVLLFWVYRSATPGKMILSMKIVDKDSLEAPNKAQCIIRYLGYFPATLVFGLGFVWVYFDKKCQGWHDKIAKTVVIVQK